MSAQGGTLARRGAVHLPIWPVAALIVAAAAVAIGMSILSGTDGRVVTSVTDAQRLENSSAAIREQGAILPVGTAPHPSTWTQAQAERYVASFAAIEASTAAVREHAAGVPFHEAGRAHEVVLGASAVTHPIGLPFHEAGRAHEVVLGGQASGIVYPTGLENPGVVVTSGTGALSAPLPEYRACDGCHQRI